MRKGFTLVELSIVLVIIGLLIGGILIAQSMIETAKIEMLIRQIQQIDAAVANFKTRYNYLPGDAPSDMGGPVAGTGWQGYGNGNGTLDDGSQDTDPYITPGYEHYGFWVQLQNGTDFNPPKFTNNGDVHFSDPEAVFGKSSGGGKTLIETYTLPVSHYNNYYAICAPTGVQWISANQRFPVFTPNQALAIDAKIDDGLTGFPDQTTYTGSILAVPPSSLALSGPFSQPSSGCVSQSDNTKYNTTSSATECCLMIAIQASSGGTGN